MRRLYEIAIDAIDELRKGNVWAEELLKNIIGDLAEVEKRIDSEIPRDFGGGAPVEDIIGRIVYLGGKREHLRKKLEEDIVRRYQERYPQFNYLFED